ncbi:MAG: membrane protein insertion efficiency factor YidD [Patescibacteria group bacterium]
MIRIIKIAYRLYHIIFPSTLVTCRFLPTCSAYSQQAFEKYGFGKGLALSIKRLLACHPLTKRQIIDPLT